MALKRAATAHNYLPFRLRGQITTPFELVHHEKFDIRNLFPMFDVAYIEKVSDGDKKIKTF